MSTKFPSICEALQSTFEADDPCKDDKRHEQGHVDCIKRLSTAMATGDLATFLSLLDPQVVMEIHVPVTFPWIRRARGIEDVKTAIVHNFSTVEAQMPTVVSTVAQGNLIDVTMRETGRLAATQEPYDVLVVQHFVFCDGRIRFFREIASHRTPN